MDTILATPAKIKNITSLLTYLNLSAFQKHPNFHILKFEDHFDEMPKQAFIQSDGVFEIAYAQKSDVEINVDGIRVKCDKDHLGFLSPGQRISIDKKNASFKSFGYMLVFTADFLNFTSSTFKVIQEFPYFNMHSSPAYFISPAHSVLFQQYMEKIHTEFQQLNEHNIEILRSYLTIFLFEAKRLLVNNAVEQTANTRAEEITFLFENLLKKSERKREKLTYYAQQLNISPIYLSECVKKATGKSPKKVMTEYLIMQAKSLLKYSSGTIKQIAYQLDFDDAPNFINFFKKSVQITPSQYRKFGDDLNIKKQ